jgi:putative ABC transport system permease protein
MRIADHIEQSFMNLRKMKLRTFLTTFGVVIGIGALVSMIAFGQGMQRNITQRFKELGLFNYITVFSGGEGDFGDPDDRPRQRHSRRLPKAKDSVALDDSMLKKIEQIKGVEWVFPEIRFPAMIRFNNKEHFTFIQALPPAALRSDLIKLSVGKAFDTGDSNALIISKSFLESLDVNEPKNALGSPIEVGTLTFDSNSFNPAMISSIISGQGTPFETEKHTFTILGIAERSDFGGPGPMSSDIFISIKASEKMKTLSATSIEDFFASPDTPKSYSAARIRVASVEDVDRVKKDVENLGLKTFALADMLKEMKIGFILLDMFLFGIGMIAITVASLGIVNTMVMSILERYREIGIMKAVGAADADVKKIIFFESATIGFLGGLFGLILGWLVSMVINLVVNQIISRQGIPYVNCFSFPWWLCLGAIAFSILVSLSAGIYPAARAAKVDPVVALRHD